MENHSTASIRFIIAMQAPDYVSIDDQLKRQSLIQAIVALVMCILPRQSA